MYFSILELIKPIVSYQKNFDLWINFSLNLNCSQIYTFSLLDYFFFSFQIPSYQHLKISGMSFSKELCVHHQITGNACRWHIDEYMVITFTVLGFYRYHFRGEKCEFRVASQAELSTNHASEHCQDSSSVAAAAVAPTTV